MVPEHMLYHMIYPGGVNCWNYTIVDSTEFRQTPECFWYLESWLRRPKSDGVQFIGATLMPKILKINTVAARIKYLGSAAGF